ncbi:MAG: hypothetical protein ACUVT2_08220 [Thiobacillaceae bacterium]
MNEFRKPAIHSGISLLVMTLSVTLAAPVLAAPYATKAEVTVGKHIAAKTRRDTPTLANKAKLPAAPAALAGDKLAATPAPMVAVSQSPVQPVVMPPTQVLPTAAVVAKPAVAVAATSAPVVAIATAPVVAAAAPAVNPYLAGWFRPIPAAALPAAAMDQLNYNARYVSDSVTSLPGKLADALPSIKTVHPTGGRDLVVASLKCPVEMMTGQQMLPANAMREGVNGLFSKLNETQMLKFDIQLVCS